MKGQWLGHLHGKTQSGGEPLEGRVIFNVDYDVPDVASVHIKFPHRSVWGEAKLSLKNDTLEGDIFLLESFPTESGDGPLLPGANKFTGTITGHQIEGTWEAGITHSHGEFSLELRDITEVRSFDDKLSWEQFREASLKNCRQPTVDFQGTPKQRLHIDYIVSSHRQTFDSALLEI
jgi:hypothetical protein